MRNVRVAAVAALVVTFAAACAPNPGPGGASTVDAQNLWRNEIGSTLVVARQCPPPTTKAYLAQTFTAGRTGTLDRLTLWIDSFSVSGFDLVPLHIAIVTVDAAGVPTDTVIGRGERNVLTDGGVPTELELTEPAAVTAGTRYAIRLDADPAPCGEIVGWYVGQNGGRGADPYTGGVKWLRIDDGAWFNDESDFYHYDVAFQTWVRP